MSAPIIDKAAAAAAKARGNAALSAGRPDEAIAAFTEAIAADPTDHVFLSNRSAAHMTKGDAEAALEDAQACVKLAPAWSKGHGRVGTALHAMRLYDEAAEAFRAGLKVEPGSAALKEQLKDAEEAAARANARFGAARGGGGGGMGGGMGGGLAGIFGPDAMQRIAANPKFIREQARRARATLAHARTHARSREHERASSSSRVHVYLAHGPARAS
jgi:stress-induced-phosphoprotein 1